MQSGFAVTDYGTGHRFHSRHALCVSPDLAPAAPAAVIGTLAPALLGSAGGSSLRRSRKA